MNFFTIKSCEALNGIQEVSGSIPLISTKQKPRTKVLGFLFGEMGSSYTADLLLFPQKAATAHQMGEALP